MAERYWVGGTGNWSDDTNHWATTSGGAPGAGNLPTASDNANFDTASNATAYTVTINTAAVCADLIFAKPPSGIVTWAGSSTMAISGSLTLPSFGLTRTYTGAITFNATSGTKTIAILNVSLASAITFDGVGGTWQLTGNTLTTSSTCTLTNGTLDLNTQNLTCTTFSSSNSNVRTLLLRNKTLACTSFSLSNSVNLTFNGTGSTINVTSSGQFLGGGNIFGSVSLSTTGGGATGIVISGENQFSSLTISTSSTPNTYKFSNNQNIVGALTLSGSSLTNRLGIRSSVPGTTRTLNATTVSITNCDLQDIAADGNAAPFSGTSIGDGGGNSQITFTPAVTRYWVAVSGGNWDATSSWSASSGGASGATVPLAQDTVIFDANSITSGGRTISSNPTFLGKNISFTGILNSPTLNINNGQAVVCGNLTLDVLTVSNNQNFSLQGRNSPVLTMAGATVSSSIAISVPGTTLTLADNFVTTNSVTLSDGSLDLNNKNLTCGGFFGTSTTATSLSLGSGTLTLTSTDTIWNVATGLTINPGTSTIKISSASGTSRIFNGGAHQYNNLQISGSGNFQTTLNVDGCTFSDITIDTAPKTVLFASGATVSLKTFHATGSAGNIITLSATSSSPVVVNKSTSGVVSCNYLTVDHMTVTAATNTWYAGANSTNNGNNSGWIFAAPPAVAGSAFLMMLN